MQDAEFLRKFADILDATPRTGPEGEDSQGTRAIMISDRLARELAGNLRRIADKIHVAE